MNLRWLVVPLILVLAGCSGTPTSIDSESSPQPVGTSQDTLGPHAGAHLWHAPPSSAANLSGYAEVQWKGAPGVNQSLPIGATDAGRPLAEYLTIAFVEFLDHGDIAIHSAFTLRCQMPHGERARAEVYGVGPSLNPGVTVGSRNGANGDCGGHLGLVLPEDVTAELGEPGEARQVAALVHVTNVTGRLVEFNHTWMGEKALIDGSQRSADDASLAGGPSVLAEGEGVVMHAGSSMRQVGTLDQPSIVGLLSTKATIGFYSAELSLPGRPAIEFEHQAHAAEGPHTCTSGCRDDDLFPFFGAAKTGPWEFIVDEHGCTTFGMSTCAPEVFVVPIPKA